MSEVDSNYEPPSTTLADTGNRRTDRQIKRADEYLDERDTEVQEITDEIQELNGTLDNIEKELKDAPLDTEARVTLEARRAEALTEMGELQDELTAASKPENSRMEERLDRKTDRINTDRLDKAKKRLSNLQGNQGKIAETGRELDAAIKKSDTKEAGRLGTIKANHEKDALRLEKKIARMDRQNRLAARRDAYEQLQKDITASEAADKTKADAYLKVAMDDATGKEVDYTKVDEKAKAPETKKADVPAKTTPDGKTAETGTKSTKEAVSRARKGPFEDLSYNLAKNLANEIKSFRLEKKNEGKKLPFSVRMQVSILKLTSTFAGEDAKWTKDLDGDSIYTLESECGMEVREDDQGKRSVDWTEKSELSSTLKLNAASRSVFSQVLNASDWPIKVEASGIFEENGKSKDTSLDEAIAKAKDADDPDPKLIKFLEFTKKWMAQPENIPAVAPVATTAPTAATATPTSAPAATPAAPKPETLQTIFEKNGKEIVKDWKAKVEAEEKVEAEFKPTFTFDENGGRILGIMGVDNTMTNTYVQKENLDLTLKNATPGDDSTITLTIKAPNAADIVIRGEAAIKRELSDRLPVAPGLRVGLSVASGVHNKLHDIDPSFDVDKIHEFARQNGLRIEMTILDNGNLHVVTNDGNTSRGIQGPDDLMKIELHGMLNTTAESGKSAAENSRGSIETDTSGAQHLIELGLSPSVLRRNAEKTGTTITLKEENGILTLTLATPDATSKHTATSDPTMDFMLGALHQLKEEENTLSLTTTPTAKAWMKTNKMTIKSDILCFEDKPAFIEFAGAKMLLEFKEGTIISIDASGSKLTLKIKDGNDDLTFHGDTQRDLLDSITYQFVIYNLDDPNNGLQASEITLLKAQKDALERAHPEYKNVSGAPAVASPAAPAAAPAAPSPATEAVPQRPTESVTENDKQEIKALMNRNAGLAAQLGFTPAQWTALSNSDLSTLDLKNSVADDQRVTQELAAKIARANINRINGYTLTGPKVTLNPDGSVLIRVMALKQGSQPKELYYPLPAFPRALSDDIYQTGTVTLNKRSIGSALITKISSESALLKLDDAFGVFTAELNRSGSATPPPAPTSTPDSTPWGTVPLAETAQTATKAPEAAPKGSFSIDEAGKAKLAQLNDPKLAQFNIGITTAQIEAYAKEKNKVIVLNKNASGELTLMERDTDGSNLVSTSNPAEINTALLNMRTRAV
jgi:hypothetical protein